jgi:hypothetical protein
MNSINRFPKIKKNHVFIRDMRFGYEHVVDRKDMVSDAYCTNMYVPIFRKFVTSHETRPVVCLGCFLSVQRCFIILCSPFISCDRIVLEGHFVRVINY